MLPRLGISFLVDGTGRYGRFKNTFDALRPDAVGAVPGLPPSCVGAATPALDDREECVVAAAGGDAGAVRRGGEARR